MKKRIFAIVLALLCLCGCGKNGGNNAPAPFALFDADKLLESGAFDGSEMAPLDAPILSILYGIDESIIKECVGYMATNTSVSADELAVFVLTDADAAVAVEEACKARVEAQLKVCESYCPAAVPRLQNAVISRRGDTVLYAVGNPDVLADFMEKR